MGGQYKPDSGVEMLNLYSKVPIDTVGNSLRKIAWNSHWDRYKVII